MSAFRTLFAPALRIAAALVLISVASAQAQQPLPKPQGRPILEVTGKVGVTNAGDKASFDLAMLESIGIARTKTSTAWTEGQPTFEGVSLKALLERLGAKGDTVTAIALNDYKVEIPIEDFSKYPVILAYRMNGELLRVRDKGPLWIVYPQDDFPALKNKETQSRWVWQVKELRIR
jgi:hypothetical protein